MQRAGAQNLRESFPQAAPLRLLATLDSLRAAITIFDPDARLVYLNAHLNHIFHSLPPHQSLIGKSYEELILDNGDPGDAHHIQHGAQAGAGKAFAAHQQHAQLGIFGLFHAVPA